MHKFESERIVARDAARMAGQLCLAVRSEMIGGQSRLEKAGKEPVTIADYGAQAVVLQHVSRYFPGAASLAEERASEFTRLVNEEQQGKIIRHVSSALGKPVTQDDIGQWLDFGHQAHSASHVWVVDPIDGTKGFLRGDQFAVAIALLVDGIPVVGALACPVMPYNGDSGAANPRGVVAVAVRGQGAFVEPLDGGKSRRMAVSAQTAPAAARIVESVEVAHTDHGFSARVLESAGIGGQPVRIDSQAKYFAVADGRAEIYIRNSRSADYRENAWDHAAGVLVVEEAGGRVTDLDGKSIEFTHGQKLQANRGILATNGPVHDSLLDAIAEHSA